MCLGPESDFFVDDIKLKNADRLKYLGSFANQACNLKTEITASIQTTSHAFYSLKQRVFDNHDLSTNTKIIVYKQCLLLILLYGSETWTLYSQEVKQLRTIQQRHLRSILKNRWFDFVANEEVLAKSDVQTSKSCLHKVVYGGLGLFHVWKITKRVNGCCVVSLQMVVDQSVAPSSVLRTTAKAF